MIARVSKIAAVLALGLAAPGLAQDSELMDLTRLVETALANNPGLKAVEETRREVEGGIVESKSAAFPQLELVSFWSRSRDPSLLNSPDFEDIIEQFPDFSPSQQELFSLAVELTQNLYTGGRVGAAIRLAKVVQEIAETQIETAQLDTALVVADFYYRLLAAQEALRTVELQEKARRSNLEIVEARLEIGEATRLERLRAVSSLAEVGPELARRQGQIEVLRANLRTVLGVDRGIRVEVAPVTGAIRPAPPLETLLAWAEAARPELADLALQLDSLALQQTIAEADGRPQVEVAGQYGRTSRLLEDLSDADFEDWFLALNLRWSFFDGGRRRGKVMQLESQQQQVRWALEDLRRVIEVEVEDGLTVFRTAKASRQAARVAADAAREARRVAAESYREGVALQVDLLDAQDQEARAELDEVDTYYQALVASAIVARALGLLPTAVWQQQGQEPSLERGEER